MRRYVTQTQLGIDIILQVLRTKRRCLHLMLNVKKMIVGKANTDNIKLI